MIAPAAQDDLPSALERFGEALRQLRKRRAQQRLERRYARQPTEATKARDLRILGEHDDD